jgi:pyruvate dehydrogenase E1 component alpha subunit
MAELTKEQKIKLYTNMVRVRKLDELLRKAQYVTAKLKGHYFGFQGQDAVGVGGCTFLRKDDYVYATHRGMGMGKYLPKGVPARNIVAELYGRTTGSSLGTSHGCIAEPEYGCMGLGGTVGTELSMASGSGISAKLRGKGQVVVIFYGDGALNRGTHHTGILMASNWKLPVVFICENNQYYLARSFKDHFPKENMADLAFGYGIPGVVVDGQDVEAVYDAVQTAVDRARAGEGPSIIECKTYNCTEHTLGTVGAPDFRPKEELEAWKARDPINLYRDKLTKEGVLSQADIDRIDREATEECDDADRFADESPLQNDSGLLDKMLYAD